MKAATRRQVGHDDIEARLDVKREWLEYFWNLAGRVISADRQALWGRILARSAVS